MTYRVVIDMTHIDDEWFYDCYTPEQLKAMVGAFELLGVEVIEVLRDGEPMLWEEYQELIA